MAAIRQHPSNDTGAYTVFDALQFTNLRPVPGWDGDVTQTRHATTALNCPSCGAVVNLHAAGQTMAAVCGSCGGVIDTANPQLRLIQAADEKMRDLRPLLEIGRRGEVLGASYELIGMLNRSDAYSTWSRGCDPILLRDREALAPLLREAVRDAGATIVTEVFHNFSPHGVSGVIVIAESHVAIHTWPEHAFAAVDIFSPS